MRRFPFAGVEERTIRKAVAPENVCRWFTWERRLGRREDLWKLRNSRVILGRSNLVYRNKA